MTDKVKNENIAESAREKSFNAAPRSVNTVTACDDRRFCIDSHFRRTFDRRIFFICKRRIRIKIRTAVLILEK